MSGVHKRLRKWSYTILELRLRMLFKSHYLYVFSWFVIYGNGRFCCYMYMDAIVFVFVLILPFIDDNIYDACVTALAHS